jgi:hypothetical protein
MTTANTVFAGPVEVVKPLMREARIKSGETLVGGMLVALGAGEWEAHGTADVGGDIYVIDMDTVGQKAVTAALTAGQSSPAFIPQVGYSYNLVLAASQTITIGEALSSNGAGAVKSAAVDGSSEALFVAEEDLTTTGATGRIKARYNPTGVNALA